MDDFFDKARLIVVRHCKSDQEFSTASKALGICRPVGTDAFEILTAQWPCGPNNGTRKAGF